MLSLRKRILVAMAGLGVLAACGARTGTASGTSVDGSVATDAGVDDARADVAAPSTCTSTLMPQEQCFTKAELEALWNNPPLGGDGVDAGPPPFDPNGCLPRDVVRDDCCNVAATGPRFQVSVCCYTFCTGTCC